MEKAEIKEKLFEVRGKLTRRGKEQKFMKTVNARNENLAKEKVLCLFGSKNKLKRRNISIDELTELKEGT